MSTTRPQPATPPPGLRVGDYRLLAKIGEGGMGVVHLAQGPDGNRVALKVLRPHVVGDDEARERLAREVASLRRVRSPRVAEVLDADPWGATPFVATRYVPGLSLHEHVRQEGPVRGEDLRHLATALAEAVLAVHSVGVLHRDIKPSNVLLEGRSPVLIDFGLARLADDPRLTVTGWLLGTPGYLAPEILYGEDATTASDVHAWAATMAFAATGRPPFGRGPAMAIMDRVRRAEHDLDGVPGNLLSLVRAGLAPDASARPTLPSVLADLRARASQHRPPDASAPGRRPVEPTMPFVLAARADGGHLEDATDVLADRPTDVTADAPTDVLATGPATGPATAGVAASGVPVTVPGPTRLMGPPAGASAEPRPAAVGWRRPPPTGVPRLQRGLLLGGLFGLVTVGFASAPYLALVALALTALLVRTWSWTTESARERAWRRGGRRWYDGPLAVASAPWYLLVASGGTLALVVWSAAITLVVGLGMLLFHPSVVPALLVMGTVLTFTLWWGPGARRLRTPTRGLLLRSTASTSVGWAAVALVLLAVAALGYLLATGGVVWDPWPGPPWRPGTLLGDVVALV